LAIAITPLGFKKPDGNESIRNGNDVISDNAQKSQELLQEARANIANLLVAGGFSGDPLNLNDSAIAQAVESGTEAVAAMDLRYTTLAGADSVIAAKVADAGSASRVLLDVLFRRDVSVVSYGAGQGGADDTAAFQSAVNAAKVLGVGVFVPALPYTVAGTVSLSAITQPMKITIEKGAVITQTADLPVFEAIGSFGAWTSTTANVTSGTRTLSVASTSAYASGDWIAISSSNTQPGGSDKIGYLRRIVGLTSTVVTFDSAVPRSLFTAQSAHIQKATFVPQIDIVGGGRIRHATSANFKTLVNLVLCRGPRVEVELGPNGGPGVTFSHCLGGGTGEDFYVHDLVDDEAGGHFGYGINLAGSSRDMRFRGIGEKCRHAITTNPGPNITNSNQYGEPENIVVDMETRDCTNKALDTHRAGWGIVFRPNHTGGSGGGIQIRSDNTHVQGGMIAGSNSVGIAVASNIVVPPTINGTSITRIAGSGGLGILCDSPAIINNPSLYGFTGTGIRTTADGCVINNPLIDGVTAGSLVGIDLQSSNNLIFNGRIQNVGTGIRQTAGKTGNVWTSVNFGPGVTTQIDAP